MNELYSDLKVFHFSSKLNDILNNRLSPPLHIRLKPTNKCNHNCYYCCYRSRNLHLNELFDPNDEIPFWKMQEIIEDFKYMGIKAVTFSGGGEPLVYPYFIETIKMILDAKIKIGVLTNGGMLKGKIAGILSKGASWVRVSMDAVDPILYSKIRNVNNNEFKNVCSNIKLFAKNKSKKCQLGVNFIINKYNYKDVYAFLSFMKKLGVNHVKVSESVISQDREKNREYYLPILNAIKQQIKKAIFDLSNKSFFIIDKIDTFNSKDNCYEKKYSKCPFAQFLTVIAADMNVYICQDKAYTKKGKLGSLKNEKFKDVWFSKNTKRKLLSINPAKDCNHHCTQYKKNILLIDYININQSHVEFV